MKTTSGLVRDFRNLIAMANHAREETTSIPSYRRPLLYPPSTLIHKNFGADAGSALKNDVRTDRSAVVLHSGRRNHLVMGFSIHYMQQPSKNQRSQNLSKRKL